MKFLIMIVMMSGLVACNGSKSSSGKSAAKSPVVEDILSKIYHYFDEDDSDIVTKLEFYDNDTVKVTKADGSSETLKQENVDEGEEDDADLLLANICSGTATGDTSFVDIRLKNASDNSFEVNLVSEVWEGTCNGEKVSCVAMLVYDEDPVTDESRPVQGYMFGLNDENGCAPIQDEVQSLLDSQFDT